jgi:hypothetical protein
MAVLFSPLFSSGESLGEDPPQDKPAMLRSLPLDHSHMEMNLASCLILSRILHGIQPWQDHSYKYDGHWSRSISLGSGTADTDRTRSSRKRDSRMCYVYSRKTNSPLRMALKSDHLFLCKSCNITLKSFGYGSVNSQLQTNRLFKSGLRFYRAIFAIFRTVNRTKVPQFMCGIFRWLFSGTSQKHTLNSEKATMLSAKSDLDRNTWRRVEI